MSQTAAHLVDHVMPHVPMRQRVLSLPILFRALLAAQPELVTPVLHAILSRAQHSGARVRADRALDQRKEDRAVGR